MTSYGFLSTYPPTECGLATFTEALLGHLAGSHSGPGGVETGVVRIVDGAALSGTRPEVVAQLVTGAPGAAAAAANALNQFDVAVLQHEYGIYGGPDGEDFLHVLNGLKVPVIVVLHTVLSRPSPHQREILERIAGVADALVVMSHTASRRLTSTYFVDPRRVVVIPHGAAPARHDRGVPEPRIGAGTPPTILTWGLLGPGKGLEWGVDALARLRSAGVEARYRIVGHTHPRVLEREGETYRDSLRARAEAAGVADAVEFDASYRDTAALLETVRRADVVLLPYDNPEQVTSGVLIEAVASRRPVVATSFPHAAELLAFGAGLLVPHRDPAAMARALRRVLTEPGLSRSMSACAARIAPSLAWSSVAARYRELAAVLVEDAARLAV